MCLVSLLRYHSQSQCAGTPRPIRWIMALHGDVVVPFMFAGILSGNLSYGLCNTPSATVLDGKKTILECSNALAKSVNGNVVVRESLLNEVVNLVMAPVPILGMFKESFLELPEDLLTMVMQKHHKYFVVTDDKGEVVAILYCCC